METNLWPPQSVYADLEPINNGGLATWQDAVQAWVLSGNNKRNISGMLDWYRSGKRDNRGARNRKPQEADAPDGRRYIEGEFSDYVQH